MNRRLKRAIKFADSISAKWNYDVGGSTMLTAYINQVAYEATWEVRCEIERHWVEDHPNRKATRLGWSAEGGSNSKVMEAIVPYYRK